MEGDGDATYLVLKFQPPDQREVAPRLLSSAPNLPEITTIPVRVNSQVKVTYLPGKTLPGVRPSGCRSWQSLVIAEGIAVRKEITEAVKTLNTRLIIVKLL